MAVQTVTVEAKLVDHITTSLNAIAKNVETQGKKVDSQQKAMTKSATSMKAAYKVVAAVVGGVVVKSFINAAIEMEGLTTQFKTLLGSAEKAKKRMKELADFAASTPFELTQVAKASKTLEVLTKGALSTGEGLRMVGDAAAASGAEFQEVAMWTGRLYDGLKSGRPVGEAAARLQELGLISGDFRGKLEDVTKGTYKSADAWIAFNKEMGRFGGGMAEMNNTVGGQWSNLMDSMASAQREFMRSSMGPMKEGLRSLSESIGELSKSGAFVKIGANLGTIASAGVAIVGIKWATMASQVDLAALATGRLGLAMKSLAANPVGAAIIGIAAAGNLAVNLAANDLEKQASRSDKVAAFDFRDDKNAKRIRQYTSDYRGGKVNKNKLMSDFENEFGFSMATYGSGKDPLGSSVEMLDKMTRNTKAKASTVAVVGGDGGFKDPTNLSTKPDLMTKLMPGITQGAAARAEIAIPGMSKEQSGLEQKSKGPNDVFMKKNEEWIVINESFTAQKLAQEEAYQDALDGTEEAHAAKRKAIADAERDYKLNSGATFFGGMSQMISAFAGKNRQLAIAGRALAIGEATIQTGLGISKALASGPPPWNFIAAAGVGAAGIANVAKMSTTKLARGGYIEGPSHSSGGVPFSVGGRRYEAEGGEFMLSKRDVSFLGGPSAVNNLRQNGANTSISYSPNIVINAPNADASQVGAIVRQSSDEQREKLLRDIRYLKNTKKLDGILV